MSSTTQNNDQKRKAVEYIQQIEDILQRNNQSRYNKTEYVKYQIELNPIIKRRYPGITDELLRNMVAESSRVILPGKQNKSYNSIELVNKWPMIRDFL